MSSAKKQNNKIYIAGPMTGLPNYNFEAFDRAATRLSARGFDVKNPADVGRKWLAEHEYREPNKSEYQELLNAGRAMLRECKTIYLLRGWQNSNGALGELSYALILGARVELEGE